MVRLGQCLDVVNGGENEQMDHHRDSVATITNYYIINHGCFTERPSNYWIGGKDEGSEGSWFWVKSGTPVPKGSPFWFTAEPDGSNAENHLVLSPNGYLADGRMDQSYYAICQAYTA